MFHFLFFWRIQTLSYLICNLLSPSSDNLSKHSLAKRNNLVNLFDMVVSGVFSSPGRWLHSSVNCLKASVCFPCFLSVGSSGLERVANLFRREMVLSSVNLNLYPFASMICEPILHHSSLILNGVGPLQNCGPLKKIAKRGGKAH